MADDVLSSSTVLAPGTSMIVIILEFIVIVVAGAFTKLPFGCGFEMVVVREER